MVHSVDSDWRGRFMRRRELVEVGWLAGFCGWLVIREARVFLMAGWLSELGRYDQIDKGTRWMSRH